MSHVPAAQVQNKQAAWANPIICCWNQLDFFFFFGEAGRIEQKLLRYKKVLI